MEDEDHDIDLDDIDLNMYVDLKLLKMEMGGSLFWIICRSDRDEESFSETKIRLDDDEGYEDDGQGINFLFSQPVLPVFERLKFFVADLDVRAAWFFICKTILFPFKIIQFSKINYKRHCRNQLDMRKEKVHETVTTARPRRLSEISIKTSSKPLPREPALYIFKHTNR